MRVCKDSDECAGLAPNESCKEETDRQTDTRTLQLREAIPRKNLLPFGILPNGLDPPPLVVLERFEELF